MVDFQEIVKVELDNIVTIIKGSQYSIWGIQYILWLTVSICRFRL